ncbi:hypothetical protein Tco_0507300, partial [Tanacetum coccineum]
KPTPAQNLFPIYHNITITTLPHFTWAIATLAILFYSHPCLKEDKKINGFDHTTWGLLKIDGQDEDLDSLTKQTQQAHLAAYKRKKKTEIVGRELEE